MGAKTAAKICFEAKGKLQEFANEQGLALEAAEGPDLDEDLALEVFACLAALGYPAKDIPNAIAHVAGLGEADPAVAVQRAIGYLAAT